MKLSQLLFASFAAFAGSVLAPQAASAGIVPTYCTCIGQHQGNCPRPAVQINGLIYACQAPAGYYTCAFAYQHAVTTDQSATQAFCVGRGTRPAFIRISSVNGDQCGYITDLVTCQ